MQCSQPHVCSENMAQSHVHSPSFWFADVGPVRDETIVGDCHGAAKFHGSKSWREDLMRGVDPNPCSMGAGGGGVDFFVTRHGQF